MKHAIQIFFAGALFGALLTVAVLLVGTSLRYSPGLDSFLEAPK